MAKSKTVTERSRKADILKAYEELKGEVESLKAAPKAKPEKRLEPPSEPKPKRQTTESTSEALIREVATLKMTVARSLGELEQQLVEESKRLEAIRGEIREGREMLKEIYDIELQAESLTDLRQKQEVEKARFEGEMGEVRTHWEREKRAREESLKEEEKAIKRRRELEEEEYRFEIELKKKKDTAAFEAELAKIRATAEDKLGEKERVLHEREVVVGEQEEELAGLRKDVEQFPKVLETRVKEAEKEGSRSAEDRLKMDQLMLNKEMERLKELNDLTVKGFQDKIKAQDARIQTIERDLREAQAQTHRVATRAVEGISGIYAKQKRTEEERTKD